jgi:hypothetical protein
LLATVMSVPPPSSSDVHPFRPLPFGSQSLSKLRPMTAE